MWKFNTILVSRSSTVLKLSQHIQRVPRDEARPDVKTVSSQRLSRHSSSIESHFEAEEASGAAPTHIRLKKETSHAS